MATAPAATPITIIAMLIGIETIQTIKSSVIVKHFPQPPILSNFSLQQCIYPIAGRVIINTIVPMASPNTSPIGPKVSNNSNNKIR
jgi:hypothetical protein